MAKKHLFSWLHKWGIANDPATEAERFTETCFVERFGRRRQSRPKTNQRQSAKYAFIIRVNPWLINDLRAYKALYICRDTFTDVMSALQISSFMQNKAKFRKSQMNVNKVLTMDYDKKTLGERGKKQSQTNPNKAKLKKAKMKVTSIITKSYENKSPIRAPKKQSQISKRQKPMQTSLPQRIMKNTALSASDKTNPNKPKTNPISKIFLTPFFGVFSTNILILTDILPSFTDIGPFSSIPPKSGQSIQGRQFNPAAKKKNFRNH